MLCGKRGGMLVAEAKDFFRAPLMQPRCALEPILPGAEQR